MSEAAHIKLLIMLEGCRVRNKRQADTIKYLEGRITQLEWEIERMKVNYKKS